jgi:hypothetical protein
MTITDKDGKARKKNLSHNRQDFGNNIQQPKVRKQLMKTTDLPSFCVCPPVFSMHVV